MPAQSRFSRDCSQFDYRTRTVVISQVFAAEYEQMYGNIGRGFPTYERAPSGHSYRWIRDVLTDIDFETMVAIAEATQKEDPNRKSIIIGFHTEKVVCLKPDCLHNHYLVEIVPSLDTPRERW